MITIKEYTEQLETENRTLYEDKNYWKKLAEKRKSQLQQKENIIKEVREYIKDACYLDEINYPNSLGHKQTMKVLEILDKEVN